MALFYKEPIHTQVQGIQIIKNNDYYENNPFKVSVTQSTPNVIVSVSRYSALLNSPNVTDRVVVLGTEVPIGITYGDKIWLETYYDRNLAPIFAVVNSSTQWDAQIIGTGGTSQNVYPDELEFITLGDIKTKLSDLDNLSNYITDIQTSSVQAVNDQFNAGFITQADQKAQQDEITTSFNQVKQMLAIYKQNMNQFFIAAPTQTYKKLFRSFTLIAYTTKNFDSQLAGILVSPPNQGNPVQNGVNTSTTDSSFKIVQALNSDLLLADICYQNRFPAKLPIPYHRAVYFYTFNGKQET